MIVHSIRLKNIKSYGEGADGKGIVVSFEPGVNRIAGKNGHGKTTLIESLGYALFLTEPQHEENFQLATYLVRDGCKAGEIDVTFGYRGETYRIERGLGSRNKRRSKVIDTADGSTCAEGDAEVSRFLCELFGFPDERRFSELFAKLIGVRQGRLTWPFDSKPSGSKGFFEPLLQVEIFRRCFDELRPALARIAELRHELKVKLAGIDARIEDRADSPEKLAQCQERQAELRASLERAGTAQENSRKEKEALERQEAAVQLAEKARDEARHAAERASEQRKDAERLVGESREAAEKVRTTSPAHDAFVAAENALKQLRERERARGTLEKQLSEAEKRRIKLDEQARAAGDQADAFAGQKKAKDDSLADVHGKLTPLDETLSQTARAHQEGQTLATRLASDRDRLRAFARELAALRSERQEELDRVKRLEGEIDAWDAGRLVDARALEDETREALQGLRDSLTQTRERKDALAGQLEQIAGGVCPFLKERCRQFDPDKVQGDVESIEQQMEELAGKVTTASTAHEAARKKREALTAQEHQLAPKRGRRDEEIDSYLRALRGMVPAGLREAAARVRQQVEGDRHACPTAPHVPDTVEGAAGLEKLHEELVRFCEDAAGWWETLEPHVEERLADLDARKAQRQKDEHSLENLRDRIAGLQEESERLTAQEQDKRDESARAAEEAARAADEISRLQDRLTPYADVADEITRQEDLVGGHREAHEAFIAAKPVADLLTARETDLDEKTKTSDERASELKAREDALAELKQGVDPGRLREARADYEAKSDAVAICRNDLKHADEALETQKARYREWEEARKNKEAVDTELVHLAAATDLGQLARSILQKSAPAVAQHLCTRIATRAQRIFNRINHDPVRLTWDAGNYSLRIAPGHRRFAMLSGGEQTKLALAMTLAMVQEFSDLRFCIFDEPTYGVDAGSRSLLADAILEAQDAAGLEQLLLVSHDDAFEGRIEHAILLEKTAATGSRVVLPH